MSQGIAELEARREEIAAALVGLGDMRQGSLLERYRKCGKANCRCANNDALAHGPSWSLTRAVKGKTVCRIIPARALEQTRRQLEKFREFRRLSQTLLEINEKICELRLAEPASEAVAAAKKKGSRQPSTPPLSQKLRR